MKLSRVKITVLAAVLLLGMVAIPAFAACPPGTTPITTGTNTIGTAGTYCVPATGVTADIAVNVSNVTIVGEMPSAILTTNGTPAITVSAAATNCTIHNFMILAGAGVHSAIQVNASDCTIEGMRFLEGAAVTFADPVIDLVAGQDTLIQNNEFDLSTQNAAAITLIELNGGQGAQILNNTVQGQTTNPPDFFVENASASYNAALIKGNQINGGVGVFVGGGNSFTNSEISDNTAVTTGDGIAPSGSTNTTVSGNNITYGGNGIVDTGGSNNQYLNNTLTAGSGTNGINFRSTNAVISGNHITAGTASGNDGIVAGVGASNAQIKDNTIYSAGGVGINLGDTSNTNFQITGNKIYHVDETGISAAVGSNHTISGNTLTNIALGTGTNYGIRSKGNNTINANTLTGVKGVGIYSTGANDVITNNTLTNINSHGVQAAGTNTTIQGNTVKNVSGSDGIHLDADNQTVTTNTIMDVAAGHGINVQTHSNNAITNNTIDSTAWSGIEVRGGDNNQIKNNTLSNVATKAQNVDTTYDTNKQWAGIRLVQTASNNVLDNNTVTNAGGANYAVGIDVGTLGTPDNNDITNNTVKGFTTVLSSAAYSEGIRVLSGQNNTVVGNTVQNSGNMQFGIDVRTVHEVPITNNKVEGMAKAGLYLWGGTAANPLLVKGNTLTGNVKGIWMAAGAANIVGTDAATKNTISGGATALYVDPSANAATFKVNGNCIDASILANNEGIGTLNATGNYWAATPQTGVNVFGNVNFSGALASCPGEPTPPPSKTHTYGAAAGWYMASVPLNSGTPSALFGTIAYRWNCATAVYDIVSMIEPKFGYWVSLPANKSVTDSGSQVTSDVTINISCTGWHQVSAPWSYPKSQIRVIQGATTKTWADAVTAGWVRDDIYAYSATGTDYTMPSTLNPWYGYWVRANVSGLSLKLLYASGTPVSAGFAPMGPKALVVPADLPPMPPSPSVGADDLEFGNYPNPVTDVYTTTFAVKGAMAYLVETIKVQIFDLAGRLVYEAEEAGTSLDWHTDSDYGEYLANGVYLYKLYALVNGEWVVSEVRKLAILR